MPTSERWVTPSSAASSPTPPRILTHFAAHVPYPHSVVTVHLIDREGEATTTARDEILDFLVHRLHGLATSPLD